MKLELLFTLLILTVIGAALYWDYRQHHKQDQAETPSSSYYHQPDTLDWDSEPYSGHAPAALKPTIVTGPSKLADDFTPIQVERGGLKYPTPEPPKSNAGELAIDITDGSPGIGLGGGVVMDFDGDIGFRIAPGISIGFGDD